MTTSLGDVYWLKKDGEISHPHLVIKISQKNPDLLTVCKITTNQKKANMPGNIILDIGEGNLEKQSIIDVADTFEINVSQLGEYIGTLNMKKVNETIAGIEFIQKTYFQ